MKAILLTAPDVLQCVELPKPTLHHATDVLIALKAAGVNPVDTKIRKRGTFYPDQMPAILGCDGAGIVEAVGSAVRRWQVGDEVYYCAGGLGKEGTGNYAEYAVVDEALLARKPRSVSFAEAAAAPLVLITAWESLFDRVNLGAGQTVLIHAGAGGVGHVAIQLAKLRRAEVYTTVGSADKARLVRQLGADHPILYKQTNVIETILQRTDGKGVDIAFDTVGGQTFFESCQAVKVYGDIVTLLEPSGSLKVARDRNLRLSFELMLTPALLGLTEALAHQARILEQCATWIDEGKLTVHLSQTFPLAEVVSAHNSIETGSVTGKIALSIA